MSPLIWFHQSSSRSSMKKKTRLKNNLSNLENQELERLFYLFHFVILIIR